MRLYLVRHGQTAWNLEGRAQGHTDIPLDATGIAQAAAVADAMRGLALDKVWSSDLLRASQTGSAIAEACGCQLLTAAEYRERSFGSMEGTPYLDLRRAAEEEAEVQETSSLQVRIGGGESVEDVWDRVADRLWEIESAHHDLCLVSHGGTCAVVVAQLLRGSLETVRALKFGNASLTELQRHPDGHWTLLRYNDTSHLAAPSAPMIDLNHGAKS